MLAPGAPQGILEGSCRENLSSHLSPAVCRMKALLLVSFRVAELGSFRRQMSVDGQSEKLQLDGPGPSPKSPN